MWSGRKDVGEGPNQLRDRGALPGFWPRRRTGRNLLDGCIYSDQTLRDGVGSRNPKKVLCGLYPSFAPRDEGRPVTIKRGRRGPAAANAGKSGRRPGCNARIRAEERSGRPHLATPAAACHVPRAGGDYGYFFPEPRPCNGIFSRAARERSRSLTSNSVPSRSGTRSGWGRPVSRLPALMGRNGVTEDPSGRQAGVRRHGPHRTDPATIRSGGGAPCAVVEPSTARPPRMIADRSRMTGTCAPPNHPCDLTPTLLGYRHEKDRRSKSVPSSNA